MHIICDKSKLIEGMNIVMKAIPGKTTMMILECVVIEVKDNQIKLIANDLQLGIETLIDGEIKQEGSVAVGAKVFFEIIRKLPSDNVSITVDEEYQLLSTLKEFAAKLADYHFICCSSSFCINMKYVTDFQKDIITLNDKTELKVSRSKKKEVKQALLDYYKGGLR